MVMLDTPGIRDTRWSVKWYMVRWGWLASWAYNLLFDPRDGKSMGNRDQVDHGGVSRSCVHKWQEGAQILDIDEFEGCFAVRGAGVEVLDPLWHDLVLIDQHEHQYALIFRAQGIALVGGHVEVDNLTHPHTTCVHTSLHLNHCTPFVSESKRKLPCPLRLEE